MLVVLCQYKVEWLEDLFEPLTLPSPVFFASREQTKSQTKLLFDGLPSLTQHLFRLTVCQESESSLRLSADALTQLPWKIAKHFLAFLLLLQHQLVNADLELFLPSFLLHRTVSYCIQRILILHGTTVVQNGLLDVVIRHALEAIQNYTERTNQTLNSHLVSEDVETTELLTPTQLTHVTTSAAHVTAFCICLEIQDAKPELEGKVVDLSVHKQDRFLPRLCSIIRETCVYEEIITERKERNRFYIASLLQCIILVLQSIETAYSLYVFKRVYSILVLMLTHERDELLVSLCLTVPSLSL